MYYRDTDAVILVYDISDYASYHNIKQYWIHEVRDKAPDNC